MADTSVIIPAYNVANYLTQCVNSVLNQSRDDLEVIIINDGSTDDTPEICERLRLQDRRVRVIHKENGGASSTRNLGIASSVGEYIFFLDGDDWIPETCLEDMHRMRTTYHCDIVCGNYCYFDEGESKFHFYASEESYYERVYTPQEFLLDLYDKNPHTNAWGKLYRRELFEHVLYPVGLIAEDDYTTWKLYLLADKIAVINKSEYYYRKNYKGVSANALIQNRVPLRSLEQMIAVMTIIGMDASAQIEMYKTRMSILERYMSKYCSQNVQDYQEFLWMKQLFKKYEN